MKTKVQKAYTCPHCGILPVTYSMISGDFEDPKPFGSDVLRCNKCRGTFTRTEMKVASMFRRDLKEVRL